MRTMGNFLDQQKSQKARTADIIAELEKSGKIGSGVAQDMRVQMRTPEGFRDVRNQLSQLIAQFVDSICHIHQDRAE